MHDMQITEGNSGPFRGIPKGIINVLIHNRKNEVFYVRENNLDKRSDVAQSP